MKILRRAFNTLMHGEWTLSLLSMLFGTGSIITSFGLGTWAASASGWLAEYGPIGWLISGLIAALLMTMCFAIYAISLESLSRNKMNIQRSQPSTGINILEDTFKRHIIRISDIYHSNYQIIENKDFKECRFQGPMSIAFIENTNLISPFIKNSNFINMGVLFGSNGGVIGFKNCTFRDCEFDEVCLHMPPDLAKRISNDLPGVHIYGQSVDKGED